MRILFRIVVSLLMMLALLLLASCNGAPGCGPATFGSTTCSSSSSGSGSFGGGGGGSGGGGGGGGGGGNNPTPAAFAYVVDQNGTLDGYDLSTSAGVFQLLSGITAPPIPLTDAGEAMVTVNKQFVYAVFENGTDDGIYGWSFNASTGALTALTGFPMLMSLNLNRGLSYNQYSMTTDPGGNFLFIANSNLAQILVYSISNSGALTAVPGSPFTTTIEAINLATDGLGRFLYACEGDVPGHSGSLVAGYSIGSNGALTVIPGSPFVVPIWQVQGDASGRYLIGTSGNTVFFSGTDDTHLYVFSIQQSGTNAGAISAVGTPIVTTYAPFSIAMQPPSSNGEFVYSFGINDTDTGYNPIEGFELDTTTGKLSEVTGSPFSGGVGVGGWGQFDQSGSNLLVYNTVVSGGVTTTTLIPLQVNSSGGLAQPAAAVTLATPGYWVVTNP